MFFADPVFLSCYLLLLGLLVEVSLARVASASAALALLRIALRLRVYGESFTFGCSGIATIVVIDVGPSALRCQSVARAPRPCTQQLDRYVSVLLAKHASGAASPTIAQLACSSPPSTAKAMQIFRLRHLRSGKLRSRRLWLPSLGSFRPTLPPPLHGDKAQPGGEPWTEWLPLAVPPRIPLSGHSRAGVRSARRALH
jgi:hypothetical protein